MLQIYKGFAARVWSMRLICVGGGKLYPHGSFKQSRIKSFVSSAHHPFLTAVYIHLDLPRSAVLLSIFNDYFYVDCSSEIANSIPSPLSRPYCRCLSSSPQCYMSKILMQEFSSIVSLLSFSLHCSLWTASLCLCFLLPMTLTLSEGEYPDTSPSVIKHSPFDFFLELSDGYSEWRAFIFY